MFNLGSLLLRIRHLWTWTKGEMIILSFSISSELDPPLNFFMFSRRIISANMFSFTILVAISGFTKRRVLNNSPKLFWKGVPHKLTWFLFWASIYIVFQMLLWCVSFNKNPLIPTYQAKHSPFFLGNYDWVSWLMAR